MKKNIALGAFLAISILLASCSGNKKDNDGAANSQSSSIQKVVLKHLKGFTVSYSDGYTVVDVRDPFDTVKLLKRYILVDRSSSIPKNLPKGLVVRVPVERSACFYGLTVSEMAHLGVVSTIVGVAEPQYVKDSTVKEGIRKGKIVDFGEVAQSNVERIIQANPEILVVSPISGGTLNKVEQIGIPLIFDCSYLENTPLARAEWIKFLALFFKKEALANQLFDSVEARYNRVSTIAQKATSRPTVFTEKKYGQVWYTPGGKSYMAKFFEDAGASYIWKDDQATGSLALSFESVLAKASNADYWILKTNTPFEYSCSRLKQEFGLYAEFKAFQNGNVFSCDTGRTPYYEDGFLEPDVVLTDLVYAFHPELLKGYKPKYYKKLAR